MKKPDLSVGIDLHSNNLTIAMVDAEGKRVKHAKMPCDLYVIEAFLEPYRARIATIAVESTYNWYWLVDGLDDLCYHVVLANPAGMVQYEGIKHADDKSDAYFIAELLRLGILPVGHIYDRKLRCVRDMFRRRILLVSKRTSLLLSLCNLHSRTHGCGMDLAGAKSGKLEDVVERFAGPHDRVVAEIQKRHIDAFTASIKRMEKEVLKVAGKLPNYGKLKTMRGVGEILGMTIILEAGPISRFKSAENFASYCRAVQAKKMTNGKKKGENNSKSGNRYLAWAFVEAANLSRVHDPRAKKWFERKMAKTNRIVATKALACKLAKAAWYILTEGSVYDGDRLFGPEPEKKQAQET